MTIKHNGLEKINTLLKSKVFPAGISCLPVPIDTSPVLAVPVAVEDLPVERLTHHWEIWEDTMTVAYLTEKRPGLGWYSHEQWAMHIQSCMNNYAHLLQIAKIALINFDKFSIQDQGEINFQLLDLAVPKHIKENSDGNTNEGDPS